MSVEKRSLKSLVKGRSSFVIRNILDEVWCIFETAVAFSGPIVAVLLSLWRTSRSGGQVLFRGQAGLVCGVEAACLSKLPNEATECRDGVILVPMLAMPTTLSLASDAKDLLLLLVVNAEDEREYW